MGQSASRRLVSLALTPLEVRILIALITYSRSVWDTEQYPRRAIVAMLYAKARVAAEEP